jgi:membrane protease YdiL (CAAX protease family)
MLFAVKNRVASALLALALLAGAALAGKLLLGLSWRDRLAEAATVPVFPVLAGAACGLAVILASDGVVHTLAGALYRERYRESYAALAAYFRGQSVPAIVVGGLTAGLGEEPLFRGVLLEGLVHRAGLSPVPAVALTAALFGALHLLPGRRLAPFALWAALQGVILGTLYLLTGSLLVCVLVHTAHDILGFSIFRRDAARAQRP